MKVMNRVFQNTEDFILFHVDDILTFSDTWEEHLKHLREMFSRLEKNQLHLKLQKCEFGVPDTVFCSMAISGDGINLTDSQIQAMCNYPQISTTKNVHQYLGSIRFFAEFVPWLSEIAIPLFNLTGKDIKFEWNVQSRVRIIQYHLSSKSTLYFFNPKLSTFCATDASDFAIGGWLGQIDAEGNERVVTYWSRRLIQAERNYPVHEREFLAMYEFIKKFRVYLHGIEFSARVDHRSMEHLQTQPELSERQIRWIAYLQEFMPNIQYIKGPTNTFADWLSRRPDFASIICPNCTHAIDRMDRKGGNLRKISNPESSLMDAAFMAEMKESQEEDALCKRISE